MGYLSIGIDPTVSAETEPFWESCGRHVLAFQACEDCGHVTHPPLPVCPRCQSLRRRWLAAPSEARVFSFTWAHILPRSSTATALPYNIALIEFPSLESVRLVSNVVDAVYGDLRIGQPVELVWEPCGALTLPRFRKASPPTLEIA